MPSYLPQSVIKSLSLPSFKKKLAKPPVMTIIMTYCIAHMGVDCPKGHIAHQSSPNC